MAKDGFDGGLYAAQNARRVRRLVLLIVALTVFVELRGVPHLRLSYQSQNGQVTHAVYWSVTGRRVVVAGEVAQGCPPIVLIPLDRPLVRLAAEKLNPFFEEE